MDRVVADAFSFGVVLGILAKLRTKATGTRLIAQQANGKRTDVWVDSIDIVVGEARNKIAEVLRVSPSSRVSIETGNGKLIEDMSAQLRTVVLPGSVSNPDFFGFITLTCYISIKEADDQKDIDGDFGPENSGLRAHTPSYNFRSLLNTKGDVHFRDKLILTARVPKASSDSKAFYVNSIDKFVAAAPSQPSTQHSVVQLVSWDKVRQAYATQEGLSENGDVASSGMSPGNVTKNSKASGSLVASVGGGSSGSANTPVRNGDQVAIECDGKYMSVTRGWWMAWSSSAPRRSGIFIVEIVERAPQNILAKNFESIKIGFESGLEKIGLPQPSSYSSKDDNILRTGDSFRLRSVKFPKFELGITNVRLRDNYCYLGLRKVAGDHQPSGDESWCTEVRFSVKVNSLSTEIKSFVQQKPLPFFSD